MAEIGSAYVSILPSARGFGSGLNRQVTPQLNRSGALLGAGLGKSMLKGFIAIGVGVKIAQFFGDALTEAREANKVAALTANVIKTTGGVAKVSAEQVDRLATALSNKTGIDDEQIATAENLILTFKNVRREGEGLENIFGRATRAAIDLSASGFGDTESTAKMLGKALNDPVKGLTALGRAGVTFTEQQQDQIKALVKTGDTLKAQKLIMAEVESQVKGSAEAQVTATDKARVAFANLKEQIGQSLVPAVDGLASLFSNKIAPAISRFVTDLQSGKGQAGAFGNFIRDEVVPALRQFGDYLLTKVVPAVRAGIIPSLKAGRNAFNDIRDSVQRNRPQLMQLWSAFKQVANFMLTKVIPAALTMGHVTLPILGKAIQVIINLAAFWVGAFNAVRAVMNKLESALNKVVVRALLTASKIKAAFQNLPTVLKAIGLQMAFGLARGIVAGQSAVIGAAIKIATAAINAAKNVLKTHSPSKVMHDVGVNVGEGLALGIESTVGKVGQAAEKLGKKAKEKLAKLRDQLKTVGEDFKSLVEPIASNFTQGLFDFDTAGAFTANLTTVKGTLTTLLANFKKLIGDGLSPGFLYQLFQSGGPGLINSLASLDKASAQAAGGLFGEVTSLSEQLGATVAGATDKGAALENQTQRLERKIEKLINHVDKSADRTGQVINGATSNGHRRGR